MTSMKFGALPFTLRQLQYAVAVAEELNFRKAAERCFVSQPSLSAQIAELERVLGIQLFERSRRGVFTTPAGERIIPMARAILVSSHDLVDTVDQHVDPFEGVLQLGVIPTIAPYLLPDLDPAIRKAFPNVTLRWTEAKTEDLVEMSIAGELDAALVALEADLGGLETAAIGVDNFVLAAPADHILGHKDTSVQASQLLDHDVLLLAEGHCFRDQALDLCAVSGATEHAFKATSLTTLVQMAASTGSVTVVPEMAVEVENRRSSLVVRRFRQPRPSRTIGFAWRKGSPKSDAMRELTKVAEDAYSEISNPKK